MTRIDKMLYTARQLDVQTREYRPCVLIEMTDTGKWEINGCNRQFDTEEQAVNFCKEQAAGRTVGIVICDIPRTAAIESADVQTAIDPFDPQAVSEAIKELTGHAKGTT